MENKVYLATLKSRLGCDYSVVPVGLFYTHEEAYNALMEYVIRKYKSERIYDINNKDPNWIYFWTHECKTLRPKTNVYVGVITEMQIGTACEEPRAV